MGAAAGVGEVYGGSIAFILVLYVLLVIVSRTGWAY
ncbi:YjcZ family sporulation protein [Ammoniphilus sp. CFH 90114]|nr:YjcZ family sporulation protein [Ammoniphilus sp. CFH 90114]RXT03565.1 YjcZ family sporulation protein [Ammoniphilus sp. CFH 90114]